MNDKIYFLEQVKPLLDNAKTDHELKQLVIKYATLFRERGCSDIEISSIFKLVPLNEEQNNTQMTTNNERYLKLLREILSK